MRVVWTWLACLGLLAGCSEALPAPAQAEDTYQEFALGETAAALGVIRGIVVDVAIQPLDGALVTVVGQVANFTTGANGAFAFKDVEPGIYFIEATKPGYGTTQVSTEVVAGDTAPAAVRLLLERVPGTEPSIQPLHFNGHITCSLNTAAAFATGCMLSVAVPDLGGDRRDLDIPEGNIHWAQTEIAWQATQETGKRLCLRVYGYDSADACGETPMLQAADQATAKGNDLSGGAIEVVVYVHHYVPPVIGLAIDQDFEAFTHVFYNFVPPEGWQFGRDGEPPVPT